MKASSETVILLSCPRTPAARLQIENLAVAASEEARRVSGAAYAQWVDQRIRIRIQNITDEAVADLLGPFIDWAQQHAFDVRIIQAAAFPTHLPTLASGEIPWGTILMPTLTRKVLDRLPEGCFLRSSILAQDLTPVFVEQVGSQETRDALWHRAKLAGVVQRRCRVIWDEIDLHDTRSMERA